MRILVQVSLMGAFALSATCLMARMPEPIEAPKLRPGAKPYATLCGGWVWVVPERRPGPVPADLRNVVVPRPDPLAEKRLLRNDEAARRYREAMLREIDIEFRRETVFEAIRIVGRKLDLNVVVDVTAATDAGVNLEDEVGELNLRGVSGETAFRRLLEPYVLAVTQEGEVAVVTTAEIGQERFESRIYPVADLTWKVPEGGRAVHDFDALIAVIQQSTPGPWWDVDGIGGTISVVETGGVNAFVIYQTHGQHEEIGELLERLRRLRGVPPGQPVSPDIRAE